MIQSITSLKADSSDVATVLVAGDKAAILQEMTNEDGLTSDDDQDEKEDT